MNHNNTVVIGVLAVLLVFAVGFLVLNNNNYTGNVVLAGDAPVDNVPTQSEQLEKGYTTKTFDFEVLTKEIKGDNVAINVSDREYYSQDVEYQFVLDNKYFIEKATMEFKIISFDTPSDSVSIMYKNEECSRVGREFSCELSKLNNTGFKDEIIIKATSQGSLIMSNQLKLEYIELQ